MLRSLRANLRSAAREMRTAGLGAALVLATILLSGVSVGRAQVQPSTDRELTVQQALAESVDAVLRAEFDRAETRLNDVRSRLSSLDEWRSFLMTRAALAFSLRDDEALAHSISLLRALAPDARFDSRFPPDLDEALAAARARAEPMALTLEAQPTPDGVRLSCAVTGLPTGLEAAPVLFVREGRGGYMPYRGCDAVFTLAASEEVAYYAELQLPNGVVAAAEGSADQPVRYGRMPAAASAASSQRPATSVDVSPRSSASDDDSHLWWWVGGGVAVAVVAAVVTTLLITSNDTTDTQPGYPVLR